MNTVDALSSLEEAAKIRLQISELYAKYNDMGKMAWDVAGVRRHELKRAVDAIYYLGGGWPHENSKGRLEALLDNFVSVFRVLTLVNKGHLVSDHLKDYGITVSFDDDQCAEDRPLTPEEQRHAAQILQSGPKVRDEYRVPTTSNEMLDEFISEALKLQRNICSLADDCKDIRQEVQKTMGLDDPESDRVFGLVQIKVKPKGDSLKKQSKIAAKKLAIENSIERFRNLAGKAL